MERGAKAKQNTGQESCQQKAQVSVAAFYKSGNLGKCVWADVLLSCGGQKSLSTARTYSLGGLFVAPRGDPGRACAVASGTW